MNAESSYGQTETFGYNKKGWLTLDSADLFVRRIRYDEAVTGVPADNRIPQYNGRISRQEWQHKGQSLQEYTYGYDRVRQLRSGLTTTGVCESIRYDQMGNIDTLWRDGGAAMKYHYGTGSNQLSHISGGLVTGTYVYDGNGNTVYDGRLGKSMRYNSLGLVDSVGGSPTIKYMYDAW